MRETSDGKAWQKKATESIQAKAQRKWRPSGTWEAKGGCWWHRKVDGNEKAPVRKSNNNSQHQKNLLEFLSKVPSSGALLGYRVLKIILKSSRNISIKKKKSPWSGCLLETQTVTRERSASCLLKKWLQKCYWYYPNTSYYLSNDGNFGM